MEYAVRVKAVTKGGKSWTDKNGAIHVENADEVMFIVSADTDYQMNFDPDFTDAKAYVGVKPLKTTEAWIRQAASYGYDALLDRHYRDYVSLFGRTVFELNPSYSSAEDLEKLSTPKRLERYRTGAPDYGLETLYYQFGRYLLRLSQQHQYPDELLAGLSDEPGRM